MTLPCNTKHNDMTYLAQHCNTWKGKHQQNSNLEEKPLHKTYTLTFPEIATSGDGGWGNKENMELKRGPPPRGRRCAVIPGGAARKRPCRRSTLWSCFQKVVKTFSFWIKLGQLLALFCSLPRVIFTASVGSPLQRYLCALQMQLYCIVLKEGECSKTEKSWVAEHI